MDFRDVSTYQFFLRIAPSGLTFPKSTKTSDSPRMLHCRLVFTKRIMPKNQFSDADRQKPISDSYSTHQKTYNNARKVNNYQTRFCH